MRGIIERGRQLAGRQLAGRRWRIGLGVALAIGVSAAASVDSAAAQETSEGRWESQQSRRSDRSWVQLTIDNGRRQVNHTSLTMTGGERAEFDDAMDGQRTFRLVRDAGAFDFERDDEDGRMSGSWVFTPDDRYEERLERLDIRGLSRREQVSAAALDVSIAWAEELQQLGFRRLDMDDLFATRVHGASPTFVSEMSALGIEGSVDDFVAFRIHGVSAAFVREMRGADLGRLDEDDLVAFRIHGVTTEFARAVAERGMDADGDDLLAMRIHGADLDFLSEMDALGYPLHDPDEAVAFRIHRVTPRFVRELREDGYDDLSAQELVEIRIHGLDRIMRRRRRGN